VTRVSLTWLKKHLHIINPDLRRRGGGADDVVVVDLFVPVVIHADVLDMGVAVAVDVKPVDGVRFRVARDCQAHAGRQ
jgi:hypothetical protein